MTSLKKLIAVLAVSLPLAVSAQQAAPAAAPAPLYQIYGTLNVNLQYVEISHPFPTGTNIAGRFGVSTDSSNVGIRGTADTGQFGLGIVYQCELSAAIDGDAGATNAICSRNSRLGITHEFGTLFLGNWDTPFKAVWYGTKADDAFGNTDIYDASGLMGSPGQKTKATSQSTTANAPTQSLGFNVRAANSVVYHSPKFMGAQVKAQYSTNERASNDGRFTGQVWSVSGNYDRGPFSVLAAYERHDDWAGLSVAKSTVDTGIRVGVGYELGSTFGATTVGAVWELLTYGYDNTNGLAPNAVKEASRQAAMFNLKHRMGNHEFRARYTYADNGDCKLFNPTAGAKCNLDIGAGAQQYALGYGYYLSKAAQVYAYYTKIENERNASYTFGTAGPAILTAAWGNGADPAGGGLGLRYAF